MTCETHEPQWAAFFADLHSLERESRALIGDEDVRHLRKIERWGRFCSALGYLTAWLIPNPLSVVCLALGQSTRFLLGHHILHGAYDRIPGIPRRYTSQHFGRGWRRYLDWFCWWRTPSWASIHNNLHHPHTQSDRDVDVMDLRPLQRLPRPLRYLALALTAMTWKFTFYTPYMWHTLRERQRQRSPDPARAPARAYTPRALLELRDKNVRDLWLLEYLPYLFFQFMLVPLLFLPLGTWASLCVLGNLLLGELLHNAHTFSCLRPSHSAGDIPVFENLPTCRHDAILRQIQGTVNYTTGGDARSLALLWCDHHIEHHLWPTMPMLAYRRCRPRLKALCEKHGLLYREGGLGRRGSLMVQLFVGRSDAQPLWRSPLRGPGAGLTGRSGNGGPRAGSPGRARTARPWRWT